MEDMSHSVESICKRSNSDFGVINGFFYKAWCLKMESSVIYEGRINNGVRPHLESRITQHLHLG